tara:strand:+ start:441 stop:572 length:132 start_codon:yes stop_codon:yes gene_type:complete
MLLFNHDDDWIAAMVDGTATVTLLKELGQQHHHDSQNASIAPP